MPSAIKLDKKKLELALAKPIEKASLPIAREIVKNKFNDNLNNFMETLQNDPLSQELIKENKVENSAFITGEGVSKYGSNVYSFFGFNSGESNPVKTLINLIKKSFKVNLNTRLVNGNYIFKLNIPSEAEIKAESPLPWTRRSWITAAERGITNVINYIRVLKKGRSKGGIQIKGEIEKEYSPQKNYFGKKYRDFLNSFKK